MNDTPTCSSTLMILVNTVLRRNCCGRPGNLSICWIARGTTRQRASRVLKSRGPMSKMQRTKGAVYEREIVHAINAKFDEPFKAKRRLGQAREGGHDITWAAPFIIEAKRRARNLPGHSG